MGKKSLIFTIAALSLICLSGCHKDKPVTKTEPLETIAPDKPSETISDKLDEAPTLSIEEAPESLSEDALVIGYDTKIDKSEVSTSESESLTESISSHYFIGEFKMTRRNFTLADIKSGGHFDMH